jgi:hypothetical protein
MVMMLTMIIRMKSNSRSGAAVDDDAGYDDDDKSAEISANCCSPLVLQMQALDPNQRAMHRLFKDSTRFKRGKHVKDLSNLNRDLRKVIIVDDDPDAFVFQASGDEDDDDQEGEEDDEGDDHDAHDVHDYDEDDDFFSCSPRTASGSGRSRIPRTGVIGRSRSWARMMILLLLLLMLLMMMMMMTMIMTSPPAAPERHPDQAVQGPEGSRRSIARETGQVPARRGGGEHRGLPGTAVAVQRPGR